jgi:glutathione S-transferase
MKLYFNPQSRAVVSKWMLDECGAEYEFVPIDFAKREHKTPEFLKINPAGKLPALVDGETKVFEGAAMIGSPERGRYLSLMVYSTSQLEPAMADRMLKVETLPQRGWTDFDTALNVVEEELGKGPYLFGDWFTAADVMIGSMCIWMRRWASPTGRPAIDAYVERLLARPHVMKVG